MGVPAEELHSGDRAGGPAAHAVIDRHHLRHGRHGDLTPDKPGAHAADQQGGHGQADIDHHVRSRRGVDGEQVEEARQNRGDHAQSRKADAGRRRGRRGHALQAEHEQEGGAKIGAADDKL